MFKKKNKQRRSTKNSVSLTLSGYNFERWLNVLASKGIEIFSAEKIDVKNSKLEVGMAYEFQVEKFLKSKNFKIIKKEYNGFARILNYFKVHFGILIGVFVCFCFYAVFSGFVWRIEVMGNERVNSSQIINVLEENDVSILSPLNGKSNEEIENIILNNFSDVSMVSVVKKGTSIIINIKEKLIASEGQTFGALLATEDGTIKNLKLIQGTPLVKAGDVVRAGDELVAPYVIDSQGSVIPIEPKAEITFELLLSGQSVHKSKVEKQVRTGKSVSERKMSFLDKEIVTTKADVQFEKYEVEQVETYLSTSILPLKYVTSTYYELQDVVVEQEFDEVRDQKIQEAKTLAMARINENDEIVYENFVISERDGRTIVDYVVCVERIVLC